MIEFVCGGSGGVPSDGRGSTGGICRGVSGGFPSDIGFIIASRTVVLAFVFLVTVVLVLVVMNVV